MCLTTRGVTVTQPMRSAVCLCAWSSNQNKALTGGQFSCRAASGPARPGTFLITIQSLSVYTISGAEWTVAQGSPWEAREAPPCLPSTLSLPPTLLCARCLPQQPHPSPAHAHKQSHGAASSLSLSLAHINRSNGRVLVLSASYLWQILKSFVAESLHHQGTISCSRGRGATHRAMSAAADLLKPRALRKSTY